MKEIYNSRNERYKKPFGAITNGQTVCFMLRWENREEVFLTLYHEDSNSIQYINMDRKANDEWTTKYQFNNIGIYFYCFESHGEYITKVGNSAVGIVASSFSDNWFIQLVYDKEYIPMKNLDGQIIYQIFPDRFYHSSVIQIDLEDRIIYSDLETVPSYKSIEGKILNNDFYGGNLAGIIEKLPYLKNLGVGIIYLNPIFRSHSNHRYDTADYMTIDPLLGTNDDFICLCENANSLGISIVLDGVFSHTGADSIYFDRLGRYGNTGAYVNKDSKYRDWYFFNDSAIGYRCWWGVYTLPEINEDNESFREFILKENGVIDYWMSLGAGGFRLDVADELPDSFIIDIRKAVKKHGEDKILIGEVWENAVTKISYGHRRKYLWGYSLDSVMNYPFREYIIDFVRYGDAVEFMNRIMEIVECYPKPMMDSMMNILSTHDTERLINTLVAPSMENDKEWQAVRILNHDEYLLGIEMAKLAFTLLLTLPGIPSIYYGDEIGMQGYGDPFNRGYFRWNNIDSNLHDYICNLSNIRRSYSALWDGEIIPIHSKDSMVAYLRKNYELSVFIAVNRGETTGSITVGSKTYVLEPWKTVIEPVEQIDG